MYNIIYKNILNGKEYVRSKSSAMTLSVGHFKGRYEAWNWKYLMEDTITMTMELELQVEEGSVNSQGKFVYLNTIWALESKVIESCYSHSSFFQIMWFVKPQNYPFSFFLQTHPPSIFCSHGWTPPHPFNNQQYFQIQHCHLCLCSFFKLAVLFFSFGIWMQRSTDYIFVCCSSLLSYFGQIICHIIKRWDQTSMCNFLFVLNSWPRPINWWEIKNTWENINNTLFDTLFLTHMSD